MFTLIETGIVIEDDANKSFCFFKDRFWKIEGK
jgi:hypothetical protein